MVQGSDECRVQKVRVILRNRHADQRETGLQFLQHAGVKFAHPLTNRFVCFARRYEPGHETKPLAIIFLRHQQLTQVFNRNFARRSGFCHREKHGLDAKLRRPAQQILTRREVLREVTLAHRDPHRDGLLREHAEAHREHYFVRSREDFFAYRGISFKRRDTRNDVLYADYW